MKNTPAQKNTKKDLKWRVFPIVQAEKKKKWTDKKLDSLGELILKHKFWTIVVVVVIPILILIALSYKFKNINIIDWYSFILGISSFLVGILVLESITEKERLLDAMQNKRKSDTIQNLYSESIIIMEQFLNYDKDFEEFQKQEELGMEQHRELKQNLTKLTQNYKINIDSFSDFNSYSNESEVNWFKKKITFLSYMKIVNSLYSDLTILKEENDFTEELKIWEDKLK